MNILFACDLNYVIPLTVCLTSIFENNSKNDICIYLLHSPILDIQKEILTNLAKSYNQKINLIQIADRYFSTTPTLRWSKEMYYRLLINEVLPKNIDKILYLDCDIIVNKPLNELYELDLTTNYLAALEEINNQSSRVRLGLNQTGSYFQSSVILFDLNKCRDSLDYEKITKIINILDKNLITPDQDVLNVLFDGKIIPLDQKFNNCKITNFQGENSNRLLNQTDKKQIDETYIFHYATGKPWNNIYSGSCEDMWYKYLLLSPYRDLYYKKYNKLKYKILRTGLVKTLFYQYINITPRINNLAQKILPNNAYNRFKGFYRKNIK
jgi:lipopolysaccharide biosynthesis glycosyltransferase